MPTHAPSLQAGDGRQARWEKHNAQRRRQILDAAVAVLEANAPGAEFHVQQIADQAGLNRTVVYRHFNDRADLDSAISERILADVAELILPAISLDGTINQIIGRIVSTYVGWVVAHPAQHHFVENGSSGPFELGFAQMAEVLVQMIRTAIDLLDAELPDDEQAALDPLSHALVGAVLGAVRRWSTRPVREPDAGRFSALLSESVWYLLQGHALRLGLDIDPDQPLQELMGA